MDHSGMTMSHAMDMPSATAMVMSTGSAVSGVVAAATSSAKPMDMHGMGNGCKISMLWNWNTVDACFISSTWQIKSKAMMAGSCIGVILLVMTLELLRRAAKEYDSYLVRTHAASSPSPSSYASDNTGDSSKLASADGIPIVNAHAVETGSVKRSMRPTVVQQAVRATLHLVQFTIAYFVMLLAMYYNGYLIISIIIGAWLGAFVFSWGNLDVGGPKEDSTYCCG